jgi:hypothetical protein
VLVVTSDKERIEGKLLGVPSRDTQPAASDGELLLVQTANGTRILALNNVRELEVRGEFTRTIRIEEQKNRLVLQVAGGGPGARVGVMYVQKGLQWIQAYRIDIDGVGKAAVQFEATLVNDLVDLDKATVHLVIGVPKFEFAGQIDPISLQQEAAQVAQWTPQQSQFSNVLSNARMSQVAAYQDSPAAPQDGPKVAGAEANEDLFVFTVREVTLKKGERLVLPIASYALGYTDLYRLDVPFAPPLEVRQNLQSQQLIELNRQLHAPKARHVLRLQNGTEAPLTTAPALVLHQGRVLAQGLMTYTPKQATTDLEINVAVDVRVEFEEHETKRDPANLRVMNTQYGRIDVAGSITLRNGKPAPIELEITRRALGLADSVGQDGKQRQLDLASAWPTEGQPVWWGWWSWPYWWFQYNGFAEFRWTVKLAPGEGKQLDASWHYFWR